MQLSLKLYLDLHCLSNNLFGGFRPTKCEESLFMTHSENGTIPIYLFAAHLADCLTHDLEVAG